VRSAAGCAAFGVVLLLVAGTFDAEPLYVTGSALALLGLGAAAWIGIGARGVRIERRISRRSVTEDEPLSCTITVKAGRFPLPPGVIDEPMLEDAVRLDAGRREATMHVEARFTRRGRRTLAPPAVVLRDPLGLAERIVAGTEEDEVLVLPRLEPVHLAAGGGDSTPAHARASLLAAAETEVDGLRPMREGTSASRIHWQSLARGAGLMERRMISEADSRPLVVLDPRGAADEAALDACVRAAASLTRHFARRTGCGLLLPGDRRAVIVEPDLGAWPALHVRLALMGDAVGPAFAAAQNRRGLVVLVSARVVDRPPRALGRTPAGCLLVLPAELPGRRAALTVAGCHGYVAARGAGAALAGAAPAGAAA
jgi:uncharacterized protein (DUF58 family)